MDIRFVAEDVVGSTVVDVETFIDDTDLFEIAREFLTFLQAAGYSNVVNVGFQNTDGSFITSFTADDADEG